MIELPQTLKVIHQLHEPIKLFAKKDEGSGDGEVPKNRGNVTGGTHSSPAERKQKLKKVTNPHFKYEI